MKCTLESVLKGAPDYQNLHDVHVFKAVYDQLLKIKVFYTYEEAAF
jgi:hypothetical protein